MQNLGIQPASGKPMLGVDLAAVKKAPGRLFLQVET